MQESKQVLMTIDFRIWIVLIVSAFVSCSSRPTAVQTPKSGESIVKPAATAVPVAVSDTFQPVKSMLGRSCAPCHNPGGKMYDRLPFDQPEVVRSHKDGILGRLSSEDKQILEEWLKR